MTDSPKQRDSRDDLADTLTSVLARLPDAQTVGDWRTITTQLVVATRLAVHWRDHLDTDLQADRKLRDHVSDAFADPESLTPVDIMPALACFANLGRIVHERRTIHVGTLYMMIKHSCSLGQYRAALALLVRAGLVAHAPNQILIWTGPEHL